MNVTSIGDLAQGLLLRSRTADIKQSISRLTGELATGYAADVTSRLGGDFAYLTDIDRRLTELDGFSVTTGEARMFADASQFALGHVQDLSTSIAADMLSTVPSQLSTVLGTFATRAEGDLGTVLTTMNSNIGGRALFSGIDTDVSPMGDAATLLGALQVETAGLVDANDIRNAADAWFADPAGFRATMYAGSDTALAPVIVGPDETVTMDIMADNPAFGTVLKNLALTALAGDPASGLDIATQNDVLGTAAAELLSNQNEIAALRSGMGYVQSRIEAASARNAVSQTSLEYTKGTLITADPFETATRLDEVQSQLESLYAVTARTARLSLVTFLR